MECMGYLPKTHYQFSQDNPIKDKLKGLVTLERAGSFLYYNKNEIVKQLLWEIKYNQNDYLAIELGRLCVQGNEEIYKSHIDVIIPIPLHSSKFQLRGYNQAELIGRGISESLHIPLLTRTLMRQKNTLSQTKFSRGKRFHNVSQAFEIKDKESIRGKRVLLIDDVITTGATLESAGRLLLEHDILNLNIFTLASAFEF